MQIFRDANNKKSIGDVYAGSPNDVKGFDKTINTPAFQQLFNTSQTPDLGYKRQDAPYEILTAHTDVNLGNISHARFDTVLVRNLIFITNIYRSIRLKLSRDLTYNREIIARSEAITNPKMTEFNSNQVVTDRHLKRYEDNTIPHFKPDGQRRGIN